MSIYTELAELPFPTSAKFLNKNALQVNYTARDHTRNIKRTLSKTIILQDDATQALSSGASQELVGIVASEYTIDGVYRVVLRENGIQEHKRRYVEIWAGEKLEKSKDVTDIHGDFYADEFLSSLSSSYSNEVILYIAEKKINLPPNATERFLYTQSFGEGLVTRKSPAIYLYYWKQDRLITLEYDAPVSLGQAIFAPKVHDNHDEPDTIFATGYEYTSEQRLLGIKWCYNRPSGIWAITIPPSNKDEASKGSDEELTTVHCTLRKITPPDLSCRSPRIVQTKDSNLFKLLWLSNPTGGAHEATASLHSLDITSTSSNEELESRAKKLVDAPWDPAPGEFPGIYTGNVFPSTFHVSSAGQDSVILHSVWGSRLTVLGISLSDGTVKDLTPVLDDSLYSWTVLTTDGVKRVVCVRSSPKTPPELVLGEFASGEIGPWTVLDAPSLSKQLKDQLDSLQVKIVPIPNRFPTETILIQDTRALSENKILPFVLNPHGGPHGTTLTEFAPTIAALALEGFTVSLPNYTGSLGFGEKYVRALIGQCGSLDVGDCIESVRYLIKTGVAEEGKGKLFVLGGSHGGFLTAHLIGQYPDIFTAAALRNPVISCGEISTSDIPDWYFAEFGLDYPMLSLPLGYTSPSSGSQPKEIRKRSPPQLMTPEIYSKLYHASPIAYVGKVKAAVLLLIGGSDQRVAPTQGIGYYHALKAIKAESPEEVEMLWFAGEGHSLDGLETTKIHWTRTLEWFKDHAKH